MRPDDVSRRLTADEDFRFYVGPHRPRMGWPPTLRGFRVCVSANLLRGCRRDIPFFSCGEPWLLDSGSFSNVAYARYDPWGSLCSSSWRHALNDHIAADWDPSDIPVVLGHTGSTPDTDRSR